MKIKFLGTGTSQGVPVISCKCKVCKSIDYRDQRLRSSVLVMLEEQNILIDAGPDLRQQMLRHHIEYLDHILITHEHKDHTGGLDDVRPFIFNTSKPMPLYAREQVLQQIKHEYAYAFSEESYPGTPKFSLHEINGSPFRLGHTEILPIEVKHLNLPVFGFRIDDFCYITDANYIAQKELDKMNESKVIVINALQIDPHISHFNLNEAIEIAQMFPDSQVYLTHISHKLGLHKEISELLPPHIQLAYDGLSIQV